MALSDICQKAKTIVILVMQGIDALRNQDAAALTQQLHHVHAKLSQHASSLPSNARSDIRALQSAVLDLLNRAEIAAAGLSGSLSSKTLSPHDQLTKPPSFGPEVLSHEKGTFQSISERAAPLVSPLSLQTVTAQDVPARLSTAALAMAPDTLIKSVEATLNGPKPHRTITSTAPVTHGKDRALDANLGTPQLPSAVMGPNRLVSQTQPFEQNSRRTRESGMSLHSHLSDAHSIDSAFNEEGTPKVLSASGGSLDEALDRIAAVMSYRTRPLGSPYALPAHAHMRACSPMQPLSQGPAGIAVGTPVASHQANRLANSACMQACRECCSLPHGSSKCHEPLLHSKTEVSPSLASHSSCATLRMQRKSSSPCKSILFHTPPSFSHNCASSSQTDEVFTAYLGPAVDAQVTVLNTASTLDSAPPKTQSIIRTATRSFSAQTDTPGDEFMLAHDKNHDSFPERMPGHSSAVTGSTELVDPSKAGTLLLHGVQALCSMHTSMRRSEQHADRVHELLEILPNSLQSKFNVVAVQTSEADGLKASANNEVEEGLKKKPIGTHSIGEYPALITLAKMVEHLQTVDAAELQDGDVPVRETLQGLRSTPGVKLDTTSTQLAVPQDLPGCMADTLTSMQILPTAQTEQHERAAMIEGHGQRSVSEVVQVGAVQLAENLQAASTMPCAHATAHGHDKGMKASLSVLQDRAQPVADALKAVEHLSAKPLPKSKSAAFGAQKLAARAAGVQQSAVKMAQALQAVHSMPHVAVHGEHASMVTNRAVLQDRANCLVDALMNLKLLEPMPCMQDVVSGDPLVQVVQPQERAAQFAEAMQEMCSMPLTATGSSHKNMDTEFAAVQDRPEHLDDPLINIKSLASLLSVQKIDSAHANAETLAAHAVEVQDCASQLVEALQAARGMPFAAAGGHGQDINRTFAALQDQAERLADALMNMKSLAPLPSMRKADSDPADPNTEIVAAQAVDLQEQASELVESLQAARSMPFAAAGGHGQDINRTFAALQDQAEWVADALMNMKSLAPLPSMRKADPVPADANAEIVAAQAVGLQEQASELVEALQAARSMPFAAAGGHSQDMKRTFAALQDQAERLADALMNMKSLAPLPSMRKADPVPADANAEIVAAQAVGLQEQASELVEALQAARSMPFAAAGGHSQDMKRTFAALQDQAERLADALMNMKSLAPLPSMRKADPVPADANAEIVAAQAVGLQEQASELVEALQAARSMPFAAAGGHSQDMKRTFAALQDQAERLADALMNMKSLAPLPSMRKADPVPADANAEIVAAQAVGLQEQASELAEALQAARSMPFAAAGGHGQDINRTFAALQDQAERLADALMNMKSLSPLPSIRKADPAPADTNSDTVAVQAMGLQDCASQLLEALQATRSMSFATASGIRQEMDSKFAALQDQAQCLAGTLMNMRSLMLLPSMQKVGLVSIGENKETGTTQSTRRQECVAHLVEALPAACSMPCASAGAVGDCRGMDAEVEPSQDQSQYFIDALLATPSLAPMTLNQAVEGMTAQLDAKTLSAHASGVQAPADGIHEGLDSRYGP
jgi:hypothetical protein